MPRQIGTSFQPGVDDQQGAFGSGGPRRAPTPGQSPIRLLNLRLPSVVGSRAPINQTLLTNPGGAALGDSQTSVMRALQAMSRPAGSVPTPPMASPMAGGVSAPPVASQSYIPAAASPAAQPFFQPPAPTPAPQPQGDGRPSTPEREDRSPDRPSPPPVVQQGGGGGGVGAPPPRVTPGDTKPHPEPIPEGPLPDPYVPEMLDPPSSPPIVDDFAPFDWHQRKRSFFDDY